jgi:alanyl-tRNA synthetase
VRQAGSLVQRDGLRFDFAHFEALTPDQLREVEDIVNRRVLDNATVRDFETEFDKRPKGTLAFFGEKYGRIVRVVDIGGYSRELCGGTHVETTGEIGFVRIVREGAIAAGTRRLEAVAGESARALQLQDTALIQRVTARLGVPVAQVEKRLEDLLSRVSAFEKEARSRAQADEARLAVDLAAAAVDIAGIRWVVAPATVAAPESLRGLGGQVLAKLGEGVVVLGSVHDGKASIVALASPAAQKAGLLAGKLVGEVCARLGGRGGGKPDFAMGGGKAPADLATELAAFLASRR